MVTSVPVTSFSGKVQRRKTGKKKLADREPKYFLRKVPI